LFPNAFRTFAIFVLRALLLCGFEIAGAGGTACERRGFLLKLFLMKERTMLVKSFAAVLVGTALLASAAFAEPPTGSSPSGLQGSTWRASKVVGLNVYNDSNEKIGSINDLLVDKSGNVKAAVIGVGGFLGMGAHLVAVSFDKIKFSDEPIVYTGAANTMPPGAGRPSSTTTTGSTATTGASAATPSKPNPWYPDHALFNATRDELTKMPEFKYSE
jgi:sporulation protein YlmC with PRC-barrel domain